MNEEQSSPSQEDDEGQSQQQPQVPSLKISLPLRPRRKLRATTLLKKKESELQRMTPLKESKEEEASATDKEAAPEGEEGKVTSLVPVVKIEDDEEPEKRSSHRRNTELFGSVTTRPLSLEHLEKHLDEISLTELQEAMQTVDESYKSYRACHKEEVEKLNKFKVDDSRRRHCYEPFITTFLAMLAERGHLADLLEEQQNKQFAKKVQQSWLKQSKKEAASKQTTTNNNSNNANSNSTSNNVGGAKRGRKKKKTT